MGHRCGNCAAHPSYSLVIWFRFVDCNLSAANPLPPHRKQLKGIWNESSPSNEPIITLNKFILSFHAWYYCVRLSIAMYHHIIYKLIWIIGNDLHLTGDIRDGDTFGLVLDCCFFRQFRSNWHLHLLIALVDTSNVVAALWSKEDHKRLQSIKELYLI